MLRQCLLWQSIFLATTLMLGCSDEGGLTIRLALPAAEELSPSSEGLVANVTLVARGDSGEVERRTRDLTDSSSGLDLGRLDPDESLTVAVELRSVGGQLLGYGRSPTPIEVRPGETSELELNVRRPLAYLPNQAGVLLAVDASRDLASALTPGIEVSGTPIVTVLSKDGGDLFVVLASGGTTTLSLVSTSTHQPSREVASGLRPGVSDLVLSSDGAFAALAHRTLAGGTVGGITIIEVVRGISEFVELGDVSRLAIDSRGELYALADRSPACLEPARVGRLFQVSLGDTEIRSELRYLGSAGDIAVNPESQALLISDPCVGDVTAIGTDGSEAPFYSLPGVSALAVAEDEIFAAGYDAQVALTIDAVDFGGELVNRLELPTATESTVSEDIGGDGQVVSVVASADSAAVLDLATVPGSRNVAVLSRSFYDIEGSTSIPNMSADVWEYQLIDATSETAAHRIRTACELDVRLNGENLENWRCGSASDQLVVSPSFQLGTISVLYGAR